MAKYIVLYNGEPIKTFDLDEPVITIGRLPENTISIANMGVSRRHSRIEEDTDRLLVLTDLNSLNGTYVNNKKVKKIHLNDGDKISIGKYTIIFRKESQLEPQAEPVGQSPVSVAAERSSGDVRESTEQQAVGTALSGQDLLGRTQTQGGSPSQAVLIETNKHVVYKLDKQFTTLGNAESDDIFVSGFMVGKGQVSIEKRDDGMYICAQKLMGKMKVNGRSVKTHLLKHKDRIEIGSSTFRFMENG
jgi:pSer/pThr/pTyr-binding forkhead associated (FHA) protein